VATGLGSGRLRPAPGTWGTLAGLLAWLLMLKAFPGLFHLGWLALLTLALTALGVWTSGRVAEAAGQKDPSFIVIDEWAGLWVALLPLALHPHLGPWPGAALRLVAPFLLFRLFDIWKPGPVNQAQGLPGGWGVVMDDVLAGILAGVLVAPLDRWLVGILA
jgi:phosphatidylglycerophosphatase A